jgi:hypothetical protein
MAHFFPARLIDFLPSGAWSMKSSMSASKGDTSGFRSFAIGSPSSFRCFMVGFHGLCQLARTAGTASFRRGRRDGSQGNGLFVSGEAHQVADEDALVAGDDGHP